ncbi:hypothetical protein [Salmonella enterica]|uniref:Uncharacterized protein n=1 Tax=Salmonella enterica TaxID=28901 RepID=A0A379QN61_SALER|nr:hypothetical protein [Salmonella enterica]SUF58565.1 Uncharacterised protein [Salmonella enterica]
MRFVLFFFLYLFVITAHGGGFYKNIYFKGVTLEIPARWTVDEKNNCLSIGQKHVNVSGHLNVCTYVATDKKYFFTMNDDGEWEAVTDGIPVLADVNVTPKFTGMSAIVACRYKDDTGYHIDQCFQAEVELPTNIMFVFIGVGDLSLFENYRKIYFSFNVK